VHVFEGSDLLIQGRNLRGERVDLADGLDQVQVEIAALRLQVMRGGIEGGGQVAGGGQYSLPQRETGGVGGKLLDAVEKLADRSPDAGIGSAERHLNLLERAQGGVQLALGLRFLV